jgi:uncharacterized membrane protein YukC
MTNQELMQEIKDLRKEQAEQHREMQKELSELKKEFFVFKGRSLGFITFLTTGIGFLFDYLKHK